jgi:hypothetical protein
MVLAFKDNKHSNKWTSKKIYDRFPNPFSKKNRTTCILCLGTERDAHFYPKKKGITLTRTIVAVEKKQEAISVD